ncbi:LruC domain-containing protein [Pseudopedobacter beijingensis]|uniref:LruC domain-containing protein n=1 Tax=Pseudopedobacter beijingensis TaxID=1207056 RepID=A0ABW4IH75_9SPHI
MKIKYLSILALAFLASCQKDGLKVDEGGKSLDEISVSSQFDWRTTQDVNLSISINDSRFPGKQHVLKVYVGDPAKGGQIISKGSATLLTPFNTKIALPVVLQEVYIERVAPDGSKVFGVVKVGNNVSVAVSETGIVGSYKGLSSSKMAAPSLFASTPKENAPVVPSDAILITQNTNIQAGKSYKAEGNVSLNNINGTSATIYVTGNATLGINFGSSLKVVVMPGAILTLNNPNFNGEYTLQNFGTISGLKNNFKVTSGSVFYNDNQNLNLNGFQVAGTLTNFGKLTLGGNLDVSGSFKNEGTVEHNGGLNNSGTFSNGGSYILNGTLNAGGSFNNSGNFTITTSGTNNFNNGSAYNTGVFKADNAKINISSGSLTNNGTFGGKELNFTGSSTVANYCKIYSLTNAIFDGYLDNYSYVYVGETSQINGSSSIKLFADAMFSTDMTDNFSGLVTGASSSKPGLFKIRTQSDNKINNAPTTAVFTGNLYLYDKNRVSVVNKQNGFTSTEIAAGKFSGGAKLIGNTNVFIPKSDCNDEGNGVDTTPPVKPDTDGDGIIDEEDDYPNDPNKAFNNYSLNYNTGGSSVAFEDNWPLRGDYDMNDVVITYRYNVVTNAKDEVVEIKADYKLLASGGIFKNGAGVQFNIPRANAKNFKSTKSSYLEEGQDSVVVILFENSREEQATWNTEPLQPSSPVVDYSISFDVVNGPKLANFGIGVYNPFIWNNSQGYGRGYETHLMGKQPTNKANRALFGTADDNSASGKKYSTKDNLPWALEIPTAPFKYPKERIAITEAYLRFAQWAESGGTQYVDWYTNFIPGYINGELLYNK